MIFTCYDNKKKINFFSILKLLISVINKQISCLFKNCAISILHYVLWIILILHIWHTVTTTDYRLFAQAVPALGFVRLCTIFVNENQLISTFTTQTKRL